LKTTSLNEFILFLFFSELDVSVVTDWDGSLVGTICVCLLLWSDTPSTTFDASVEEEDEFEEDT
jgi:hypothetical protein